jgi:peroxiredoxin Q/BCP
VMELPNTGDLAPDFCLQDMDEERVCLSDFRGRYVVLYFYPKDNTTACTLEAKNFTREEAEFAALGVPVIGISPDPPQSHRKFAEKHDLRVLLLSDTGHEVLERYGIWQKKRMYGKEYMGVVRSTVLIDPAGKIAAVWPKVKVRGHVDEVKTTLSGVMEEKKNVSA